MKKILGIVILVLVYIGIFIVCVIEYGFKDAAITAAIAIVLTGVVLFALKLID